MIFRRSIDAVLVLGVILTIWRAVGNDSGPTNPSTTPPVRVELGTRLTLPDVDWRLSTQHVILAIRSTCPACEASAGFYRELSERLRSSSSAPLIVVTRERRDVIQPWLNRHSIRARQVLASADLSQVGIVITPTILLADNTGAVTDILVGGFSSELQEAFYARLAGTATAPLSNTSYAAPIDQAGLDLLRRESRPLVLDVRDRAAFARAHHAGAINIPRDELKERAPAELSLTAPLVIDCRNTQSISCEVAAEVLIGLGARRVFLLVSRLTQ
jgi:rhodanese-related sulfurtransferase